VKTIACRGTAFSEHCGTQDGTKWILFLRFARGLACVHAPLFAFLGAKIRKVYNSKQKIGLKISVPLKKAPTHTAWVCIGVDLKSYKI
jgi:hypothetical protein